MNVSDKLALENEEEVILHKEGVFWVAYEMSAYAISQVKTLKPTKKYIKIVDQEVVSVGFPAVSLETVTNYFVMKEQGNTLIMMKTHSTLNQDRFNEWKSRLPLQQLPPVKNKIQPVSESMSGSSHVVFDRIRQFKLYTASPMDCMRFIEELQNEYC